MDAEINGGASKPPTQEELAAVKVFPLIIQLKKDAIVRCARPACPKALNP
jgi:hypothetical protein